MISLWYTSEKVSGRFIFIFLRGENVLDETGFRPAILI
jgi:hypothetical protein